MATNDIELRAHLKMVEFESRLRENPESRRQTLILALIYCVAYFSVGIFSLEDFRRRTSALRGIMEKLDAAEAEGEKDGDD